MPDSTQNFLNFGGRLTGLREPLLMGILNVTPDSFYDGGKHTAEEQQHMQVDFMLSEGMDILDVGAYSSRPGAKHVSEKEEWDRLEPALKMIRRKFNKLVLSLDTFRAEIARRAVEEYGVDMINDISSGFMDDRMIDTIARLEVPYVMMHMQGTPQTMQLKPEYQNVVEEIMDFFVLRIFQFRKRGVKDIIIDPGFGFGKTIDQNYEILRKLDSFRIFNLPILVGLSRKSMIYNFLNQKPEDALPGSIVLQVMALQRGAGILRTHDVGVADMCRKLVFKDMAML